MGTSTRRSSTALDERTARIEGRLVSYAVGGAGIPVLFLHGWGLGHRAYEGALRELAARGCRVFAPALPGFGGTAGLPSARRTIAGYAAWVDSFVDTAGIDEPALVIGHSFGGGVAIQFAHEAPERVRQLVLINSVGHPGGVNGDALSGRSGWRTWSAGLTMVRDAWSVESHRVAQAITEDVVRNVLVNPAAMVEIGLLARSADLSAELGELKRREMPILVLWSERDTVLPLSSFEAVCAAIGSNGTVLKGGHCWLLANPRAFSQVLENVVEVHTAGKERIGIVHTSAEIGRLLRHAGIPRPMVGALLKAASPLWMMSEPATVLATDLALCDPPLAAGEVRAVARPMEDAGTFRLTVVAADRPGLLADTAAALADEDLSVMGASVATWAEPDVALHSLTVSTTSASSPDWDALGARLRSMTDSPPSAPRYAPAGRATVTADATSGGRSIVKVVAPDVVGLLENVCRWFSDHGVSIEAAEITTGAGVATDRFLVVGRFEPSELARHLSRPAARRWGPFVVGHCRLARVGRR